jgi:hypothetical protein
MIGPRSFFIVALPPERHMNHNQEFSHMVTLPVETDSRGVTLEITAAGSGTVDSVRSGLETVGPEKSYGNVRDSARSECVAIAINC